MNRFAQILISLTAIGCSPWDVGPAVDGIQPTWGYNGEATSVEIAGDGFFAGIGVSGGEVESYNRDFMVSLAGSDVASLRGVKQVSNQTLQAVVPDGLVPGWYDLAVTTPAGATATLVDAFEVTATRADAVHVDVERASVAVQEVSIVRLRVVDPDGVVVPEAVEVEVRVSPNGLDDSSALSIDPGGLNQTEISQGGDVVTGLLNPTGEGFVGVTSSVPLEAWVEVSASIRGRPTSATRELISFRAGTVSGVDIRVPSGDFAATAGQPFDVELSLIDADGNVVTGQTATLALMEGCAGGALAVTHTFVDSATVSLAATKACPDNYIRAFGAVDGAGVDGSSSEFFVGPGPLAGLDVLATPDSVRAGVEEVTLFVQGVDLWGNLSVDPLGDLIVGDEIGELSDLNGNGRFDCGSTFVGEAQCSLELYRTTAGSPLVVETSDGVAGESNPVQVLSGPGEGVQVDIGTGVMVAGVAEGVILTVIDAFGNPLMMAPYDIGSLVFTDDDGPVGCTHVGTSTEDLTYSFQCTVVEAGLGKRIFVQAPTLGALGQSDLVDVVAGEIDVVTLTMDEDVVSEGIIAGDTLLIAGEGFDAFGNRVGGELSLDLISVGGGLLAEPITLTDGVGAELVGVTQALRGESIWVSLEGRHLGGTRAFDVSPGPATGLDVQVSNMWGFVGEPWSLDVALVDDYNNATTGGPYPYDVDSLGGLVEDDSGTVSSGGTIDVLFSSAGISDTVEVTVDGYSVTISDVDVGLVCEGDAAPSVSIAGRTDGRICLDSAGTFAGSAEWSMAGLIHAAVFQDGAPLYRGAAVEAPIEIKAPGSQRLDAFLIDADGCGAAVGQNLYAGRTGGPVGVVSTIVGSAALIGGSSGPTGGTNIDVSALQCSGDAAAAGMLNVWVNLGELEAVDGTVLVATGEGIEVELDGAGEGTVHWSVSGVDTSTDAAAIFGLQDGSSFGQSTVAVNGDSRAPRILEVDPTGLYWDAIDVLVVEFSEPILSSTPDFTSPDYVSLQSGDGDAVAIVDAWFDPEGRTLTIEPEDALDGSIAAWELTITDEFRDVSGNRLDGDYDGIPGGDWLGAVGFIGSPTPDVTTCALSAAWFRPDGDDGIGSERDYAWIEVAASGPSEWWRLDVFTGDGQHVQTDFYPRGSPLDGSVTWDGRGADGKIVEAGRYVLEVAAVDEFGGAGAGCAASVIVRNLVEAP